MTDTWITELARKIHDRVYPDLQDGWKSLHAPVQEIAAIISKHLPPIEVSVPVDKLEEIIGAWMNLDGPDDYSAGWANAHEKCAEELGQLIALHKEEHTTSKSKS